MKQHNPVSAASEQQPGDMDFIPDSINISLHGFKQVIVFWPFGFIIYQKNRFVFSATSMKLKHWN